MTRVSIAWMLCSLCLVVGVQRAYAASLTVLHNNDAESQLLNDSAGGSEFGGSARFVTAVNLARREKSGRDVLTISSGDNFLASPELNATFETLTDNSTANDIYFDARVLNAIGYDAIVLGNHDFDYGAEFLADFIERVPEVTFLSANINFNGEPRLKQLVVSGRIAKSVVVQRGANRYGIIGITTGELRRISSPGNIAVLDAAAAVIFQVKQLRRDAVDKIIVASHLQSLQLDVQLLEELNRLGTIDDEFDISEIDLVVAGGGGELLLNETDRANDATGANGPYPVEMTVGKHMIPIVTTPGSYEYLGVIDLEFDSSGQVTDATARNATINPASANNPVLVSDHFANDEEIVERVTRPVEQSVQALRQRVIGISQVPLDGRRATIRTRETNLGNLVADAFVFAAKHEHPHLFAQRTTVAIVNGGGIRNDGIVPAGPLSEFHTFEILPFASFLAVFENVSVARLLRLMEHALSRLEDGLGQFAQISGFEIHYDPHAEPFHRIHSMSIAGEPVVIDGRVNSQLNVDLVTIDFLALDGDGYPFRELGMHFTVIPTSYQQALRHYLTHPEGLGGTVHAAHYPANQVQRIFRMAPDAQ